MKRTVLLFSLATVFVISCQYRDNDGASSLQYDARTLFHDSKIFPVVVCGSGVAGLTSALYLARAHIPVLVLEGPHPGGALTESQSVCNWPGVMEAPGDDIITSIKKQVLAYDVMFEAAELARVDFSSWPYKLTIRVRGTGGENVIQALSCIIAMGAQSRFLGIPGEEQYWGGRGVSNCAPCDGAFYKGKDVVVIGGGDSAMLEAAYLASLARNVTIVVRSDSLRAHDIQQVKSVLAYPNVKIRYQVEALSVNGDGNKVTSITLFDKVPQTQETIPIDGVFLAIGYDPNTEIFKEKLARDERGYLIIDQNQQTSQDGIYAAGDVADPRFKQAVTGAGDGCKAAFGAIDFLKQVHYKNEKTASKKTVQHQDDQEQIGKVIEIKTVQAFDTMLTSHNIVVVDFYAPWCGPCRRLAPSLETLAQEYVGKIHVIKVSIDTVPELKRRYNIGGIPHVLFFKNGVKKSSLLGLKPYSEYKKEVISLLRV